MEMNIKKTKKYIRLFPWNGTLLNNLFIAASKYEVKTYLLLYSLQNR